MLHPLSRPSGISHAIAVQANENPGNTDNEEETDSTVELQNRCTPGHSGDTAPYSCPLKHSSTEFTCKQVYT